MKPRVLFVGRTRYTLPLSGPLARKLDALGGELDVRVLASSPGGRRGDDPRSGCGRAHGAGRSALLGSRCRSVSRASCVRSGPTPCSPRARTRRPRRSLAARARVRRSSSTSTATGAPRRACTARRARRALAPVADALGTLARPQGRRGADDLAATRAGSSVRGRRAGGRSSRRSWISSRSSRRPAPLPGAPGALFVGVLERYKNVDGLAAAWRRAAPRSRRHASRSSAGARAPTVAERSSPTGSRRGRRELDPARRRPRARRGQRARAALALRGLGRVVVEAFCAAGPCVGATSAASPISSPTARTACSSSRDARGARRRARRGALRPRRSSSASRAARAARR